MNLKNFLFFVIAGLLTTHIAAQTGKTFDSNAGHETYDHNWAFGAGFNIVDDSGKSLGGISDPHKYWNFSTPFYINAEYFLNNKFSFGAMFSTNKYTEGKQIDEGILVGDEASYFAADLSAKYSFRDLLQTYIFDPYVFAGFGFSSIGAYKTDPLDYELIEIRDVPSNSGLTVNFGIGFNYWFSDNVAANLNLAGKVGTSGGDWRTNQKQYTLGVIYLLN